MSDPYDAGRKIALEHGIEWADWMEARGIARDHLPPEEGDHRRAAFDAERIRKALALPSYAAHVVRLDCFNAAEARLVESFLTPDELARVEFSWLGGP